MLLLVYTKALGEGFEVRVFVDRVKYMQGQEVGNIDIARKSLSELQVWLERREHVSRINPGRSDHSIPTKRVIVE